MTTPNLHTQLPLDLGDNLVLRWATPADTDALAEFNHRLHDSNPDIDSVGALTRAFMSGEHPQVKAGDFTLVEHNETGEIVSSMNLISQTWSFGGIPFKFGRPELVGTDPAYRRRSLVRKQFEVIHALSAARGELMQGITGIESFYRMFGYEMAMHLGGGYDIYKRDFPKHDPDKSRYRLRPAELSDLPFLRELYTRNAAHSAYSATPAEDVWRYELNDHPHLSDVRQVWQILENRVGERLGFVLHSAWARNNALRISQIELAPELGYLTVLPALLHGLWEIGKTTPTIKGEPIDLQALWLRMGPQHPLYDAWPHGLHHKKKPYAWYIRVPDLPAFLRHVRSALEANLANSVAASYSGDLHLNFFSDGLRLAFDDGRISEIARWQNDDPEEGDAHFPGHSFLHVLCGRRRGADLRNEIADCWMENHAQVLLDALFPPFHGLPWMMG